MMGWRVPLDCKYKAPSVGQVVTTLILITYANALLSLRVSLNRAFACNVVIPKTKPTGASGGSASKDPTLREDSKA